MDKKMKESNNSNSFLDLFEKDSQKQTSFNSEKIYDKSCQNLSSGKYIAIIIYKI